MRPDPGTRCSPQKGVMCHHGNTKKLKHLAKTASSILLTIKLLSDLYFERGQCCVYWIIMINLLYSTSTLFTQCCAYATMAFCKTSCFRLKIKILAHHSSHGKSERATNSGSSIEHFWPFHLTWPCIIFIHWPTAAWSVSHVAPILQMDMNGIS